MVRHIVMIKFLENANGRTKKEENCSPTTARTECGQEKTMPTPNTL